MPRGVYDRSKSKAKPGIATAAPTKPAKTPKMKFVAKESKLATDMKTVAEAGSQSSYVAPEVQKLAASAYFVQPLYQHLASITEARHRIAEQAAGHNPELIGVFDAELTQTVKSLTAWREASYPIETLKPVSKIAVEEAPAEKPAPAPVAKSAPVAPVAPAAPVAPVAPAQATAAVPPLPFTPQTAHEVVKQAQG